MSLLNAAMNGASTSALNVGFTPKVGDVVFYAIENAPGLEEGYLPVSSSSSYILSVEDFPQAAEHFGRRITRDNFNNFNNVVAEKLVNFGDFSQNGPVVARQDGLVIYADNTSSPSRFMRATDGQTFSAVTVPFTLGTRGAAAIDGDTVVFTHGNFQLASSTDAGLTWTNALSLSGSSFKGVRKVGGVWFVYGSANYVSTDAITWTNTGISLYMEGVQKIGSYFYLFGVDHSIYRTTDPINGSWALVHQEPSSNVRIYTMAGPDNGTVIRCGTSRSGIGVSLISTDGGASFQPETIFAAGSNQNLSSPRGVYYYNGTWAIIAVNYKYYRYDSWGISDPWGRDNFSGGQPGSGKTQPFVVSRKMIIPTNYYGGLEGYFQAVDPSSTSTGSPFTNFLWQLQTNYPTNLIQSENSIFFDGRYIWYCGQALDNSSTYYQSGLYRLDLYGYDPSSEFVVYKVSTMQQPWGSWYMPYYYIGGQ